MLGPKNPGSSVCWCLSHRLDWKTNRALTGPARGEYVRELCGRTIAPGVLAYADAEVAGWAAVAPRSELPFARSTKIPHVDDLPAWSVWCIPVRPGYPRRRPARPVGWVHPCPARLPRPGHLARPARRGRGLRAVSRCAGDRGLSGG